MTKPVVFMYSGQGSQYFHMTRELYEHNARYRLWLEHCDEIASPVIGKSLLDTIFDPRRDKSAPFDSLPDSSAALVCVEYSLTRVVQELGHQCDFLLGYSLGEITAAVVAEALPLEDGISFAVEFARLLEQRTPRAGMLAVVGSSELLRTHESLFAGCWVTGRNFEGNFVVSGRVADIDALERALESKGVLCQRLPVDYGVHTELIDPVEEQARRLMDSLSLAPPQIPILSSATADRVDAVSADGIWAAVRQPVEFSRTIEKVTAAGGATFVDLGPSATLATFVKYIAGPGDGSSSQVSAVNRFGNDVKSMNDFQEFMAAL
ncbi:acyltransferase domain-containing protein [Streptomyces netropsis]|uniref:Acyl transferase domain-containing protein n=1 Tax=Streptomyces netropsis TaxID=55404 RepID=A0A7W7L9Z5_STRNE|nr:acyltransferase domain-containing protein [Streptomyces netropsis]MBB4886380.1 acyl transferase domain-containing protein [Streptomyces netropsis]GGR19772.1 polyketide biosynthesis acyltransferase PksD [Streptomyces netropsis]